MRLGTILTFGWLNSSNKNGGVVVVVVTSTICFVSAF